VLRTNLATRPFYNERAAHVVIGAAAVLVCAITIVNAIRIVTLSRHNTELSSRTAAEHAEAERLTAEAARVRKTINTEELAQVAGAAQEANWLIDQRTFSWTEFFNQIESTLPGNVMLSSVRPSIKPGETQVTLLVLAKRFEDVEEFNDRLEATGSFDQVNVAVSERMDSGLFRAQIETVYTGPHTDPPESQAGDAPAPSRGAAAAPAAAAGAGALVLKPAPAAASPGRAGGRQ
jgi:Tfp pilus assembly protein PilN